MTILTMGLPGSGKSFFSSRLAQQIDAAYIKSDAVRAQMGGHDYTFQNKMQVYDAVLQKTTEMLQQHRKVVVDATFFKQAIRAKFKTACEKYGRVYFIEIKADEAITRERLQAPRADSDADFEVYKKLVTEWEPMNEYHLVLVSTNQNINELLATATTYLQAQNDKGPNQQDGFE